LLLDNYFRIDKNAFIFKKLFSIIYIAGYLWCLVHGSQHL
ncbi:MAG: hypothetical protein ACI8RD_003678, partial [Bacillariaceae sp.]